MKNKDPLFQAAVIELLAHPGDSWRMLGLRAAREGGFSWLTIEGMGDESGNLCHAETVGVFEVAQEPGGALLVIDQSHTPNAFLCIGRHAQLDEFYQGDRHFDKAFGRAGQGRKINLGL